MSRRDNTATRRTLQICLLQIICIEKKRKKMSRVRALNVCTERNRSGTIDPLIDRRTNSRVFVRKIYGSRVASQADAALFLARAHRSHVNSTRAPMHLARELNGTRGAPRMHSAKMKRRMPCKSSVRAGVTRAPYAAARGGTEWPNEAQHGNSSE